MNLDEYQKAAWATALPSAKNREYISLGLVAEVGEICGRLAKAVRDGNLDRPLLKKELGDAQWFIAAMATLYGWKLGEIASENIIKLKDRQVRGKLQGDGDTR